MSATPPKAPETEGEVYDRLTALILECELIGSAVSLGVQLRLQQAQTYAQTALDRWMAES